MVVGTIGDAVPVEILAAAATAIDAESALALAVSRFIDHHPLKPLREWAGKDFGTYDPGD